MVPDGASCWICLDDGLDEEGKPLIRECSCRGNAGFAHLSCIVKYAKVKSERAGRDMGAFEQYWETCPNCDQNYRGQVAQDLSSAFVQFAEAAYDQPGNDDLDKIKVLTALRLNIDVRTKNLEFDSDPRDEIETEIKKFISKVEQTKKDLKMDGWVHLPKNNSLYMQYEVLRGCYEAYAYTRLGMILDLIGTEESYEGAIKWYKKAQIIFNLLDDKASAKKMEDNIASSRRLLNVVKGKSSEREKTSDAEVKIARANYEYRIKECGENSCDTISAGLWYGLQLRSANHTIEALRLVTKLAATSRRVHGPDHESTKQADELLEKCKPLFVNVMGEPKKFFYALRYSDDGENCVVTGPVATPRRIDEERIFHVSNDMVYPSLGCPVICHGLMNAPHLNGKAGDVRAAHETSNGTRFAVHFEDKSINPALVKLENMRIAFELSKED